MRALRGHEEFCGVGYDDKGMEYEAAIGAYGHGYGRAG